MQKYNTIEPTFNELMYDKAVNIGRGALDLVKGIGNGALKVGGIAAVVLASACGADLKELSSHAEYINKHDDSGSPVVIEDGDATGIAEITRSFEKDGVKYTIKASYIAAHNQHGLGEVHIEKIAVDPDKGTYVFKAVDNLDNNAGNKPSYDKGESSKLNSPSGENNANYTPEEATAAAEKIMEQLRAIVDKEVEEREKEDTEFQKKADEILDIK